jgi:hypothetical protein
MFPYYASSLTHITFSSLPRFIERPAVFVSCADVARSRVVPTSFTVFAFNKSKSSSSSLFVHPTFTYTRRLLGERAVLAF